MVDWRIRIPRVFYNKIMNGEEPTVRELGQYVNALQDEHTRAKDHIEKLHKVAQTICAFALAHTPEMAVGRERLVDAVDQLDQLENEANGEADSDSEQHPGPVHRPA